MTTGDRIRQLRKKKNMSLEELSKKVGTNRSTILRYETGAIRLIALAYALGTSPSYLMGEDEYDNNFRMSVLAMTNLVDQLNEEGVEKIKSYAQDLIASGRYRKQGNTEFVSLTKGERIRIRRKELGLTLEELAQMTGTIKTTIYKYEHGKVDQIPPARMEALAKALRTTPAWLSGWSDEKDADTK